MDCTVNGQFTAEYLWEKKGIVPFLKVDEGLAELENGVQLMKPISDLNGLLKRAIGKIFLGQRCARLLKKPTPLELKNS